MDFKLIHLKSTNCTSLMKNNPQEPQQNPRRTFFKKGLTGVAGSCVGSVLSIPAVSNSLAAEPSSKGITDDGKDATKILARYALSTRYEDLPAAVIKQTQRALVNFVGVTVGSSRHPAVNISVESLSLVSGSKQASILGRPERFDILNATFINGVASHVFDFDDTHLLTNVHCSGPVASALLAYSEIKPISGREFMNAFYLGIELMCRLSNSIAPNHADIGWHVSGLATLGVAAAIGRLMQLSEQQMIWALGLAASQPVGFRDSFGSMNKSFNPGRAASNGLFAALLAQKNFTSSDQMIEARVGWANAVSTRHDYHELLDGLGVRFETLKNTYKPFACGVVIHPALDAAIQLKNEYNLRPEQIKAVHLRANPMVLELTGKRTPKTGLEGKFSVYHSVAIALLEGRAGERQYSDEAVQRSDARSLREKIEVEIDPKIPKQSGELSITTENGQVLTKFIDNALGSLENPMSDAQLDAKFKDLLIGVLPQSKSDILLGATWHMDQLEKASTLASLTHS